MMDVAVQSAVKPELLSPAGEWEALRAAVANGADAVYFGLENFNARHRAQNFREDELPAIMAYLHEHNVKGFLTFNTLIFSEELEDAARYIRQIAAAGVDAVIVQDLGLARLIHAMAPSLPIHGSTQMTLTEPRGIEFVRELGVQRVVLARELSIDDIRRIRQRTPVPVEVFIHGALCVAYSGQCMTSESFGGRSANRGQCAQACRLPYDLIVDGNERDLGDKSYLLSPQDLAAYDLVDELVDLGVCSFKIEGRLKSPHYVAATTQTYRAALDAATGSHDFAISPAQKADLQQTFSRGFTHGFLSGVNHQELVAARFPKARGRRIGTIAGFTDNGILIELEANLHTGQLPKPGDGVVFDEGHPDQDEQGGRVYAVRPRGRDRLEIELGHGDVNLHALSLGALVWITDDPAMRKRLERSFARDTVARRRPIDATLYAHVGQNPRLTLACDGISASAEVDQRLEAARAHPLSEAVAREQLGRLGDTPFELRHLTLDTANGPMVPKSILNDLRRQAVAVLNKSLERSHSVAETDALHRLRAQAAGAVSSDTVTQPALYVLVRTLGQLQAVIDADPSLRPTMVYCDFEDVRKYTDAVALARPAGLPIALATLRIVKPTEEGFLKQVLDAQPDAILVRNLAAMSFYHQVAPHMPLVGDHSLNIANELTARLMADHNLVRMVPSYDLNWKQLDAMLHRSDPSRFEAVIHQHMPMFHMEHCVFAHTLSTGKDYRDCGRPCETHQVDLRDRMNQAHPLIPDVGCRNTVYNQQAQSAAEYLPRMLALGLRHFRIELLREQPGEIAPLLRSYHDGLRGENPRTLMRGLKVLHQLGVTRGTLEHE